MPTAYVSEESGGLNPQGAGARQAFGARGGGERLPVVNASGHGALRGTRVWETDSDT